MTYLCSCLKTGQLVAVKALDKLHPEYERDAAVEEIRILAAVRCAACVLSSFVGRLHAQRSGSRLSLETVWMCVTWHERACWHAMFCA